VSEEYRSRSSSIWSFRVSDTNTSNSYQCQQNRNIIGWYALTQLFIWAQLLRLHRLTTIRLFWEWCPCLYWYPL
jgi:hypothetical protein